MLVTISASEKFGFEKAAALSGLKVDFFTQETNDRLLTMQLEDTSKEMVFHFTRMAETQNEIRRFSNPCEPKNWHLNSNA